MSLAGIVGEGSKSAAAIAAFLFSALIMRGAAS